MSTWIFQANPKNFNIDQYLREYEIIIWEIKQRHFANRINIGDVVYTWRANGGVPDSGGVVGVGKSISLPEYLEDDASNLWVKRSPPFPLLCVRV